jgi:hypothetical protein
MPTWKWAASMALMAVLASPTAAAPAKPKKQPVNTDRQVQYSWDECFQASIERGMDHEYEEWRQFIADCIAGQIPMNRKTP